MARKLTERDIQQGFWYHRPEAGFPPPSIRDPEDYDGQPLVNVVCTQTNLPPREQNRLVGRWCDFLPTLSRVEFLWFHSKVPQQLFEAACKVPGLQGLWVKWSSIKCIGDIGELTNLRFLHLGSSTQLTSIEPLKGLRSLIWLELANVKQIHDLTVIGELRQLQGLVIQGSMWTTQVVDSLAPLAQLSCLRHLALWNLKAKDKTLSPLFSLSSLEQFQAARWWKEEELNQLRKGNPKLRPPATSPG